jgi:YegS/Rv2252/BmrU family lipid kinase
LGKEAAAILNPAAGGARFWPRIAAGLGELEVRVTKAPGHATVLARELAAAGFERIYAAGGDGTLNEVVNGILPDWPEVEVGVLPMATGGDFARAGCPADRIDVARAGSRYFVNAASVGLGAEVAGSVRNWWPGLPGRARYLGAAARALASGRGYRVVLRLDDGSPAEYWMTTLAIANGQYQGGGIRIAPDAELTDGLLNVTLVQRIGLAEVARNVGILYDGRIYSHPKVRHWTVRKVRVEGEGPVEVDGEVIGGLPVEIEIVPGALRLAKACGRSTRSR